MMVLDARRIFRMYDPQSPDSEMKEIERESSYGRREYTTHAQIRKDCPSQEGYPAAPSPGN